MINQGAEAAQSAAFDGVRASPIPTVGWFVRRSALWISILTAAVVFACSLYALASQAGTDDVRVPLPHSADPMAAEPALKV